MAVTLDAIRDFYTLQLRSTQRFLDVLSQDIQNLDNNDAWLEQAKAQTEKGALFFCQAAGAWDAFREKVQEYYEEVKAEGERLGLQELSLAGQGSNGDAVGEGRYVHPELQRFKLEKQAKIIGRYGGAPALGAMVLPKLERGQILKATASPAAREIHYSQVEDKDARHLAEVMRFKSGASTPQQAGTPLSPWQAETAAKKGRDFVAQPGSTTPGIPRTPVTAELAAKLAQRQGELQAAEEEEEQQQQQQRRLSAAGARTPFGAAPPGSELAQALARRAQAASSSTPSTPAPASASLSTPVSLKTSCQQGTPGSVSPAAAGDDSAGATFSFPQPINASGASAVEDGAQAGVSTPPLLGQGVHTPSSGPSAKGQEAAEEPGSAECNTSAALRAVREGDQ